MNDNDEPVYLSDDDEEMWGDTSWRKPANDLERAMLSACNRTFFKDQSEANKAHRITNGSKSLTTGYVTDFPTEWIEDRIEVVRRFARQNRFGIRLKVILSAIQNEEKKNAWIAKWQETHKITLQEGIDEDGLNMLY